MKTLHIAVLFPSKNSDSVVLCGAKSKDCRTFVIDSKVRLDKTSREMTKAGYRYCEHCLVLMRQIQPVGNALWRLIRAAERKFEQRMGKNTAYTRACSACRKSYVPVPDYCPDCLVAIDKVTGIRPDQITYIHSCGRKKCTGLSGDSPHVAKFEPVAPK